MSARWRKRRRNRADRIWRSIMRSLDDPGEVIGRYAEQSLAARYPGCEVTARFVGVQGDAMVYDVTIKQPPTLVARGHIG